ncbi:hypothetical protein J437_LFUL007628, partial [Ladona fulva]
MVIIMDALVNYGSDDESSDKCQENKGSRNEEMKTSGRSVSDAVEDVNYDNVQMDMSEVGMQELGYVLTPVVRSVKSLLIKTSTGGDVKREGKWKARMPREWYEREMVEAAGTRGERKAGEAQGIKKSRKRKIGLGGGVGVKTDQKNPKIQRKRKGGGGRALERKEELLMQRQRKATGRIADQGVEKGPDI